MISGLLLCGMCVDARLHDAAAKGKSPRKSNSNERSDASPHGDLELECGLCHGTRGWRPAKIDSRFDHSKFGFRLEGAHAKTECVFCHDNLLFTGAPSGCASCHQDVHQGEFGNDCARCHQTRSFIDRPAQVAMHRTTRFPLTGAHASLDCDLCHRGGTQNSSSFVNTPTSCDACHMDNYMAAKNPDHQGGGFSRTCTDCHNTVAWAGGSYRGDHSFFPLRGGHANLECGACHVSNRFSGMDRSCWACHETDYNTASSPNHVASGFPTDCATCHDIQGWAGAKFDHGLTGFALTGAHTSLECSVCHGTGSFSGLSGDCVSCHEQDYAATVDPQHGAAGFSRNCGSCHETTTWLGARYDHTQFALTGAHGSLDCTACHGDGVYAGRDAACFACHQQDYTGTTDPNHLASNFPTDCTQCHNTTSFAGATFSHTTFPLTGGHTGLDCAACHSSGVYSGLPSDCVSCHRRDYDSTVDPNHAASGFSTNCTTCHSTTSWVGAQFDHSAFPLTGAHGSLDCNACHGDGVYSGRDPACVACHQQDYANTTDPNHAAAGFPTDCSQCHGTTSFLGATFSHTSFPLTGGHTGLDCAACHSSGVYSGLSSECVFCHQDDYNATTDPRHGTASFGTDCATCHTTTSWNNATFDHDAQYFPIYSSTHRGKWNACSDCHVNQANYSDFTCFNCHAHDRSRMDSDHSGVTGYRYDSFACYDCHPTGNH